MFEFIAPMTTLRHRILTTTALATLAFSLAGPVAAQVCDDTVLPVPAGCERPNAGLTVATPVAPNTEADVGGALGAGGFSISIDNETIAGAPAPANPQRAADLALGRANVDVKYDGLDTRRMLNVSTADLRTAFRAGEVVNFRASSNYPAYIARSEVRISDRSRPGNPVIATVPINANGTAAYPMPAEGDGQLSYTLRVYDAAGRYDETQPLALTRTESFAETANSPFVAAGEGEDRTRIRTIPVHGGVITVSGEGGTPGGTVTVMGEPVPVDGAGRFVVSRVLPAGDQVVDVDINGRRITRDVEIPRSEWFYVGIADVTAGLRRGGANDVNESYVNGRLAYYVKGTTNGGYTITSSLDTRDGPIEDIFRRLNDKDPRRVLDRLREDGNDLYPTYGDDSTSFDDTPTSGQVYLRVENETSRFTFGNFKAGVTGPGLLNNTRDLYGIELRYQSPNVTANGDPRFSGVAYGAQLETAAQRDILRGTGGSVYFLTRQDITGGSTTLQVQVVDPDTGRVIENRVLVEGVDYTIDHIQGVVLLKEPLNSAASGGGLIGDGSAPYDVNLVAQYEYTPTTGLSGANALGGRAEVWATDQIRLGVTVMREETGAGNQNMAGVDLRYQLGQSSYAELEVARSDGPGFARSSSTDGGLTIVSTGGAASGSAQALRFSSRLDLADLGMAQSGFVGAYYEGKDAGFSTATEEIVADQTLVGVEGEIALNDRISAAFNAERFASDAGDDKTSGEISATYQLTDIWAVTAGLAFLDKTTAGDATETGRRTDAALRLTYTPNDDLKLYVFGQATVSNDGGLSQNNRLGVGGEAQVSEQIAASAELSGGDTGTAAALRVTYAPSAENEVYLGYTLDPTRTGAGSALSDNGTIVMGGRYQYSEALSTYAENIYDMPGHQRSLTNAYGVTYTPNEAWTFAGSVEKGTVRDDANGDFDRTAFSFGGAYAPNADVSMRARLEYRTEDGAGTAQDRDTVGVSVGYSNKINQDWRVLANAEALYSNSAEGDFRDGEYLRASLGYAYRPIDNERFNMLLRYTILHDLPGEDQVNASGTTDGPLQRSQVLSVAANYDLNRELTLGGKLGYRLGQVADRTTRDFESSTATLAALRLDWHVVNKWDIMGEGRILSTRETGTTETGAVVGVYRQMNENVKLGLGYEWGAVSDDATDLNYSGQGLFVNLIGQF